MICYLAWSKHGVSRGVGEEGLVFSVSPLVSSCVLLACLGVDRGGGC